MRHSRNIAKISIALIFTIAASIPSLVNADVLDNIKERGVLKVGGKTDYKPFGFRDSSGAVVGMSVDLAEIVGKELGVKVEIIPTTAANQIQFLEQGRIDVLIAAMNDTPERRKVVDIVEPGYYASGANLLVIKNAQIKSWNDLEGQTVCGTQGAYFNRAIQQDYGANVVSYKAPTEAYNALRNGNCIGFVYDDNSLSLRLESADWKDYEMPLQSIMPQAVAMAVKKGEKEFHQLLTELSEKLYKSEKIKELEDKWFTGKKNTYVKEMIDKYK